MLIAFSNSKTMFVHKVTLTTSTNKKGDEKNIMFYITFYCVKKYILMNCTKLLFKQFIINDKVRIIYLLF